MVRANWAQMAGVMLEESMGGLKVMEEIEYPSLLSSGISSSNMPNFMGASVLVTGSSRIPIVPPVYMISIAAFSLFAMRLFSKVSLNKGKEKYDWEI